MKRNTADNAFTLIELLVVVAIITALLAILMPSLGKAVATAQLAACSSNNRQIGQAATMHLVEHERRFPLAGHITDFAVGSKDTAYLQQYKDEGYGVGFPLPLYGALGRYTGVDIRTDSRAHLQEDVQDAQKMSIYACPSQADVSLGLTLSDNGWSAPLERTSYGFNEAVFGSQPPYLRIRGSMMRIFAPARTMLFADAKPREDEGHGVNWVAYFNHDSDSSTSMLNVWQNYNAGRANQIDRERHAGKMSVTYADGHAAAVDVNGDDELDSVWLSRGIR